MIQVELNHEFNNTVHRSLTLIKVPFKTEKSHVYGLFLCGFWSVPDDRHDNITMEIINGWGSLEWTIEDPPVEARFACVTIESYKNMFYHTRVVQTGNTMMHLVLFSMIFCKTFLIKMKGGNMLLKYLLCSTVNI